MRGWKPHTPGVFRMNVKIRELREKHICKLLIAGGFYFAVFRGAGEKSEFSRAPENAPQGRIYLIFTYLS
jgi:hypothetical protein